MVTLNLSILIGYKQMEQNKKKYILLDNVDKL